MVLAEGIAVSGEYVSKLKDKRFAVGAAPRYEEFPNIKDPSQTERRLVMKIVVLEDRSVLDYYPNKTSIKTMVNLWGFEMDKWVGHIFEWETSHQKVMGEMRHVLFVKNEKIQDIEPPETNT